MLQVGLTENLPIARAHPMPALLTQAIQKFPLVDRSPDYFDQIERRSVGYLVWSQFPVQVWIDEAGNDRWQTQVKQAVVEWQRYFPLVIGRQEGADIRIQAQRLPLKPNPKTGILPRFRSAQTTYEVFLTPEVFPTPSPEQPLLERRSPSLLKHRMTIVIPPGQADGVMLSVARHELGHAIGLWGHSPNPQDVMYFAQVKSPPLISPRDLQTLYRVYEQPTRLGWPIVPEK